MQASSLCQTSANFSEVSFRRIVYKVVSFKHVMQIAAHEVLPMKVIIMHVFLCYLETSISVRGDVFI